MNLLYVIIGVPVVFLLIAAIGIPISLRLERKMAAKMNHISFREKIRQKREENGR